MCDLNNQHKWKTLQPEVIHFFLKEVQKGVLKTYMDPSEPGKDA